MFTIEPEGLGKAKALLDVVMALGSAIRAVELNAKKRKEGGDNTNAEILEFLADSGRDFVTLSDADKREMESTLVAWLEKGLGGNIRSGQDFRAFATEIAAKAFTEAAKFWQDKISENIRNGKSKDGPVEDLSPEYKNQKQKKYGFVYPIGVASGQLRDNVAPESRNLKLRK